MSFLIFTILQFGQTGNALRMASRVIFLYFSYTKFVGVGKKKKKRVQLDILDTAGQEEMSSLLDNHLQNKDSGRPALH